MQRQLVVVVERYHSGVVEVEFRILCVGDIEQLVVSACVFAQFRGMRDSVEQIARRFATDFESVVPMVVCHAESYFHYEQVLVVVAEDNVAVVGIVEIFFFERRRYPGHVDIVEVNDVYLV